MPTKVKEPNEIAIKEREKIAVIEKFLKEKSSEFPSDKDHEKYCHLIDTTIGNHTLCLGPVYGMSINRPDCQPLASVCPECRQKRCLKCIELYKLMMGLTGHAI